MAPKVKLLKLIGEENYYCKKDKMTTQNDAEDEHDENERANLASTHDDNNRCKYPLPIPLISNIENPLLATILRFF
jgi:hypothetical protein